MVLAVLVLGVLVHLSVMVAPAFSADRKSRISVPHLTMAIEDSIKIRQRHYYMY